MSVTEFSAAVGLRLKELRESNGLTLRDVALELQVSNTRVLQWERGEGSPPIEKIAKLAVLYRSTTDFLLTGQRQDADFIRRFVDACGGEDSALRVIAALKGDAK